MSRSYKHTPRCGDKKDKFFKNYANRRLRRNKLIHNLQHKSYKKNFCSYDICDYDSVGLTFERYYSHLKRWHYYADRKTEYQRYAKFYLRK